MKMKTVTRRFSRYPTARLAALALGGVLLAGCAGNPPTEQFSVTEAAVRSAVGAGATQYAPAEMTKAQEKWREAEMAMARENYDEARRLAEQAEWDARVAERAAQAEKARRAVEEANQAVEELRKESMRGLR